jgi:hypothetical protein
VAGGTRFFFAVGATVTFEGEGSGGKDALVVAAAGVVNVGAVEDRITVAAGADRLSLAPLHPWIWKAMTTTTGTMRTPNAIFAQFSQTRLSPRPINRLFTDPL